MFDGNTNWLERVPFLQAKLNRTCNSSQNTTSYEIIHGHNSRLQGKLVTQVQVPEVPQDKTEQLERLRSSIRKRLQQTKIEQSIQNNKGRRHPVEFKVCDLVILSIKYLPLATAYRKTAPEFIGPLPITKASYATDNYTVTLPDEPNTHDTFHVEHLKPYIPNENKRFPNRKNTKPGPLPKFEDQDRYEVERIVRDQGNLKTSKVRYYFKWKEWRH